MSVYNRLKSILGLSFQLAKASFKMKNEGSYLGILWYLLEPLALFVIFMLIRIGNSDVPFFALYLFIGLIMFNFFTKTTVEAVETIETNSEMIKSLKINKEVFVVSAVLKSVFSHFFEIVAFLAFMIYFGAPLLNILWYPLVLLVFLVFTLGVCFFVATIGVYVSDFSNVWSIITRVLFFGTPIFYVIADFNGLAKIEYLNPLYYFITIARELVIYGRIPETLLLGGACLFSLLAFLIGFTVFELNKKKFAESV
jgi:lipopolysaccharide transport system permease protein